MKKLLLISALLAALSSTGCATASPPQQGAATEVTGKLVMKGSMPIVWGGLIRSDTKELWEVQGVARETLERLQNKTVRVEGVVVRAAPEGPLLPSLRVTRITPAQE
jgi:hypothetical protein